MVIQPVIIEDGSREYRKIDVSSALVRGEVRWRERRCCVQENFG